MTVGSSSSATRPSCFGSQRIVVFPVGLPWPWVIVFWCSVASSVTLSAASALPAKSTVETAPTNYVAGGTATSGKGYGSLLLAKHTITKDYDSDMEANHTDHGDVEWRRRVLGLVADPADSKRLSACLQTCSSAPGPEVLAQTYTGLCGDREHREASRSRPLAPLPVREVGGAVSFLVVVLLLIAYCRYQRK